MKDRNGGKRMTIEERNNKLKHLITCMKCEVSGKSCDENCPTQYNAGNMGEVIENLEEISKILEQENLSSVAHTQKTGWWVFVDRDHEYGRCSECGYGNVDLFNGRPHNYCPNCGAKMGEDALTTMMSISDYKLIKKDGYNDGYYWDTRYCFELNGMRYILTDVGSSSGYIPNRGEIMEVENDENLDMLLKDWDIDKIDVPEDLSKEDAIQFVQQLKHSGTEKGEAFVLWSED